MVTVLSFTAFLLPHVMADDEGAENSEGGEETVDDGGVISKLTDESMMPTVASKRVFAVLFHQPSKEQKADSDKKGDQKGADLIDEMHQLATLSKGQCESKALLFVLILLCFFLVC